MSDTEDDAYNRYCNQTQRPFVLLKDRTSSDDAVIASHLYARSGKSDVVRVLRGWKMRTVETLMSEFGAALQFFEGFGENWPALEDCLRCMDEWMPAEAYVLVVHGAHYVLCDDYTLEIKTFLNLLDRVGSEWSEAVTDNGPFNRSAVPFHVLFIDEHAEVDDLLRKWRSMLPEIERCQ